ncbi:MAG: sodium:solute symporter family protein [Sedimentisphaerales bacterium]|nr:sodium:solute symporter family protein [Sedimentisphaerales bacterium]
MTVLTIFGFHPLDILMILIFLAVITYIGKRTSAKIKTQEDFFMAGRSVGKILQYFLNMSTTVDANSAVRTASFTYEKGMGGIWLMLAGVFSGPYYWFLAGWFRRTRMITMAELFEERFKSKVLPSIYACVGIWLSLLIIGIGYRTSLRTFEALTIKPLEKCTPEQQEKIALYNEFVSLDKLYRAKKLPAEQVERHKVLNSMYKQDEIYSYVSYTNPTAFYVIYTVSVAAYTIMGGLEAAVWANVIQGTLIIVFSIMLIPLALVGMGGWGGFTSQLPENMLYMFGTGVDEFSWSSIAGFTIASFIIGMTGHQGNMGNNGSAKDELTARIGNIGGAYTKRILTIMWGLVGLLAFAHFSGKISDPDTAWGMLSNDLLCVGMKGLMIAGIMAANMSTLCGVCVYLSALFVRHLYKPFVGDRGEKNFITASRFAIVGFLLIGIYISVFATGIIHLVKAMPSINIIFGAPVMLLLFWKKLTLKSVYVQVIICSILFAVLPEVLSPFDTIRESRWLTTQTNPQTVVKSMRASQEDVDIGLAAALGQEIKKEIIIPPKGIFYDKVARRDPDDPNSPMKGLGRINVELIMVNKLLRMDLRDYKPSMLLTIRYIVASLFPFCILIPVSLITRDKGLDENINRFYVKMKTPVIPDRQKDAEELEKGYADPTRLDHTKLFPNTNWEFCKWTAQDTWGFLISSALTVGIVGAFWLLLKML